MNNTVNILFYSRICSLCNNVLIALRNENLISHFKLFCVDDNLNSIPKNIKKVPTMMVEGVDKLLIEHEIFEWIKQVKFLRHNINNIKNTSSPSNNDPIGWIEKEMNGISDSYAYKDVDKAMVHSYSSTNDTNDSIFTPKETNKKINPNLQLNMINDVRHIREEQDFNYKKIHKEQQLEKLSQLSNNSIPKF